MPAEDTRPFVSVVVPVYSSVERLAHCLAHLERQTWPRELTEVIVIDNGAGPALHTIRERFPRTSFDLEARPGSYAARNRGIAIARGDVLAFTDADCIPAPDWIARGVEALRSHEGVGIAGGEVELFSEGNAGMAELHQLVRGYSQQLFIERFRFAATANLFTTREVFRRVGTFDPSLMSGGDYVWGRSVTDAGFGLVLAPKARVRHPARRTLAALARRRRRTAGGHFAYRRRAGQSRWGSAAGTIWDYRPQLLRFRSHPELHSPGRLLQFALAELVVSAVAAGESVRILLGGRPRRS